ncbi:MAG: hypothetical protein HFJ53_03285 [Clostridia bacterium]|jgi:hypothetical protein|nr:hypothetical protein [Clostridia bacterium]
MSLLLFDSLFKKKENISANRFLNIRDIQGNFLYTIDNKVLAYLKIYTKNCKLMSKDEQVGHGRNLTKSFVAELKPFKLFFTNRPIDLAKNQDYQLSLIEKENDSFKYNLLEQRNASFNSLATRGRAVESEIYFIIWEENNDYAEDNLMKRLNEIKLKFANVGYKTEILTEKLIIQLVNSFNNTDDIYLEDSNYLESPLVVNI